MPAVGGDEFGQHNGQDSVDPVALELTEVADQGASDVPKRRGLDLEWVRDTRSQPFISDLFALLGIEAERHCTKIRGTKGLRVFDRLHGRVVNSGDEHYDKVARGLMRLFARGIDRLANQRDIEHLNAPLGEQRCLQPVERGPADYLAQPSGVEDFRNHDRKKIVWLKKRPLLSEKPLELFGS